MVKKGAKRTYKKKASPKKTNTSVIKEDNSQKILVENFVALQSVMTKLSSNLNDLTEKISKLLELFEESAKSLMEKGGKVAGVGDKEVSEKLNRLLDQNKTLAQGIALLHESNANQNPEMGERPPMPQEPKPRPMTEQMPPQNQPTGNYQRSISSKY